MKLDLSNVKSIIFKIHPLAALEKKRGRFFDMPVIDDFDCLIKTFSFQAWRGDSHLE